MVATPKNSYDKMKESAEKASQELHEKGDVAMLKNSEWESEELLQRFRYILNHATISWQEIKSYSPQMVALITACHSLLQERSKDTVGSLIEKLGDKFENLTFRDGKWICNYLEDQETGQEWKDSEGPTPLEALQKLSEQLNQK